MSDVLWLAGDGIGPEIITQAQRVAEVLVPDLDCASAALGGCAIEADGKALPDKTLQQAQAAKMIMLGAVGGPQWDQLPAAERPEKGLLQLRKALGLFANIRPAKVFPALVDASSLKAEVVSGLDMVIVRELTGGLYFGTPRGIEVASDGSRVGVNTYLYSDAEIERIAHVAFKMAAARQGRLCSVDKANVLEVTQLWREILIAVHAEYPEVTLTHLYVDNAAMQLIRNPRQFDVMVTWNMFGDILSDAAAELTGSIGMLPSASIRADGVGLFEPCHGSAPDIAGQSLANPLATLLSLAMGLRHSLGLSRQADILEQAIANVVAAGIRTPDIAQPGAPVVSTDAMGTAVIQALEPLL